MQDEKYRKKLIRHLPQEALRRVQEIIVSSLADAESVFYVWKFAVCFDRADGAAA